MNNSKNSEEYYEIDEVTDFSIRKNNLLYLKLKWKDYPDKYNTWEPMTNINNKKTLIKLIDEYIDILSSKRSFRKMQQLIQYKRKYLLKDQDLCFIEISSDSSDIKSTKTDSKVVDLDLVKLTTKEAPKAKKIKKKVNLKNTILNVDPIYNSNLKNKIF